MKSCLFLSFFLCVCLVASCSRVSAYANCLTNPSFEDMLIYPWTNSSSSVVRNSTVAYTGAWSLYIPLSGSQYVNYSFATPVYGGDIIEFSTCTFFDTTGYVFGVCIVYNDSSTSGMFYGEGNPAGGWSRHDFTSHFNDAKFVSVIMIMNTDRTFNLDEVILYVAAGSSTSIQWVEVPNYVQFVLLFVITGLPAFILGMAGAKAGWGLQGLLFGGLLGLGGGVMVGLIPFWLVFLVGIFAVLFLYSMAKRS